MVWLLGWTVGVALANNAGKTGVSTTGCASCHGASADRTTTVTFAADDTTVTPGSTVAVTLAVSTTSSSRTAGGLNVSATGGSLAAGTNTQLSSSEITHSGRQSMSGGTVTFRFSWTAPTTEGTYRLRGAGNAVNANSQATGDGWNLASDLSFTVAADCVDDDGDGVEGCEGDCDDGDPGVRPGADERCDGVDEDCDGSVDEDAIDAGTWYRDADGDGFGDPSVSTRGCVAPVGYVADATDCDDADPSAFPGGVEVCGGGDEDCDGAVDDADPDVTGTTTWYGDGDGDGYGDDGATVESCVAPDGHVAVPGDCDDLDPAFNPGAVEACDGKVDYNCDGSVGFADADGDGWAACEDCDDGAATVNPEGVEACNLVDDDCDGTVDEADAVDAATWYRDADGDGYGDPAVTEVGCSAPPGFVADATDCDDTDAALTTDCTPDDTGGDDTGDDTGGGDTGDDPGGDDTGAPTDTGDGDDSPSPDDLPKGSGCGCATGSGGGSWGLAATVLGLALLRRRR